MREVAEQFRRFEGPSALDRVWKVAAIAAFLTLAAVAIWLWAYQGTLLRWFRHSRTQIDFSRMTVRPLASQPGLEDNPSISPDGLWISCLYRANAVDHPQLQVHSIKGGPPVVINTGRLVVQGPAAWSPSSRELAVSALDGSREHSIYRVPRTGGTLQRITDCRPRLDMGCEIDWSPNATMLAVADRWPGNSETLRPQSRQRAPLRDLIKPDKLYVTGPRFSPDGTLVAFAKQPSMSSTDLYVVPVDGGAVPRRIAQNPSYQREFAWSADGKSLVAASPRQGNKLLLWQFPLDGREPERIGELDGSRGSSPSISRLKGALAWVRDLSTNSLWRMPADQSGRPPEPLVNSAAVDIDAEWSSTGRMVFRSDRSGVNELWVAKADGSNPWQATHFRGPFVGDPHWSPDGRSVAFSAHPDGNPDIFVMLCEPDSSACGEPRQMTRNPAPDANPTWSRDGRLIYFSSSRSGEHEVWRMAADGIGDPERITWNGGYLSHESADGKWLYYSKLWQKTGFWRVALPARGQSQLETPVIQDVPFRAGAIWALGLRELFYYPSIQDPAVPFPAVRAVDLETGRTRDLQLGNIRLGRGLSLSPDERWLLRSQNDRALTLIMIAE